VCAFVGGGGGHTRRAERGWVVNILEEREIELPSYSNNLSTVAPIKMGCVFFQLGEKKNLETSLVLIGRQPKRRGVRRIAQPR
jgi:hypothetical protein